MNKDELVTAVLENAADRVQSKAAAKDIVETVFTTMAATLKKGDEVSVHGFGTFKVKHRAARTARNPITGEPVQVAAKKAVSFKPAKALKDEVNSKGGKKR